MITVIVGILAAIFPIVILSWIIELVAFKDHEPTSRAAWTTFAALVSAWLISGFGMADGGNFVWQAGLFFIPAAILVFFWRRRGYQKRWNTEGTVADTFE